MYLMTSLMSKCHQYKYLNYLHNTGHGSLDKNRTIALFFPVKLIRTIAERKNWLASMHICYALTGSAFVMMTMSAYCGITLFVLHLVNTMTYIVCIL